MKKMENDRKKNFRKDRPRERPKPESIEKTWTPKTSLGLDVLNKKYANLEEVILSGRLILESEIVDFLEPEFECNFINVGQAKGKFGGGRRKPSKQTQKTTKKGSKMSFSMICVCGNKDGILGLGFGKSCENVPSREKSVKNSKKNLIIIRRGCGDWGASQTNTNSIPFSVIGKSGSCQIKLIPAPPGTGIIAESEVKKLLELAGIKDIWSKTFGSTKNKTNLMKAVFNALLELQKIRLNANFLKGRAIKEGSQYEVDPNE